MSMFRLGVGRKNISKELLVSSIHRRSLHTAVLSKPWFISEERAEPLSKLPETTTSITAALSVTPKHTLLASTPLHLRKLHEHLKNSPFLEQDLIKIIPSGTDETTPVPAPPLPSTRPKGRRRVRGGTDFGVGISVPFDANAVGEVWPWLVFAQMKESANRKAALSQLLRSCKQTLPCHYFDLSKGSTEPTDGWSLIDAGDFAIHILNSHAKQKWFPLLSL